MKNLYTILAFVSTLLASSLTIAQTCTADATVTLSGNPGVVEIIDNSTTSSGAAATYSWIDFYLTPGMGYEGTTYLQPNMNTANHQFTQNGTYNYYISVEDSITGCYDSIAGSITVNNIAVNCDAGFSFLDTLNNQTYFYPNNYDQNLSYSWDFGDGNSSTDAYVNHTYSAPGSYNVCLIAWDSAGSSNCADTVCQVITPNINNCDANFYHLDTTNGQTYFLPNNYDQNLSYSWDFGDGNSSTNPYPTHTYNAAGTYTACLIVWDSASGGQCADTVCHSVVVTNNIVNCNADFYLFEDSTVNTNLYYIWDLSTGTNLSYSWDFGDGTVSTQQYPTHTYANVGIYTICLTITDNSGNCTDQYCETIEVVNKAQGTVINVVPFGQTADLEDENSMISAVKLFPNPTSSNLNIMIRSNNNSNFDYQIVDVMGNKIKLGNLEANQNIVSEKIDVEHLKQGVYFIQIIESTKKEKVKTLKFIKK